VQGMRGTTTRRLDGIVLVFMLLGALFAGRFVAFFSTAVGLAVVVIVVAAALLARLRISADGELAVRSVVPWWRRVSLPMVTTMRLFERVSYGSRAGGSRRNTMEYRTLVCELRDSRGRRVRFWPGAYDDPDGAIRAALVRVARQGATVEGADLLRALSPRDGPAPPPGP
jgi:hypothetical protein